MGVPKLSIIIPAYNVEDYIATCIESVLRQSFQDFELIIINDGSSDATHKILKDFNHHPQVTIIQQKNSGLSAARNNGARRAKGEYLIFLDADDFLVQNALENISEALSDQPDLLRFQLQDFFPDGQVTPYHEEGFAVMPGVKAWALLANYHYLEMACIYAYRREFFEKYQFKYAEGRLAEDFGLTPLIIARANSVKSISAICYNYRQRSGSIMHNREKIKQRTADTFAQLKTMLPTLARIEGAGPIAHFCVISALTLATSLPYEDFQNYYTKARYNNYLKFISPTTLRALPRSLAAKFFPIIFYKIYHH